MKKFNKISFCIIAVFAIGCLSLIGCSESPDTISEGQILKKYNKQMEDNASNQKFCTIRTGYYETESMDERCMLKQLEAAGVITVSFERYAWWEKSKKSVKEAYTATHGYYWYSYTTTEYRWVKKDSYDFVEHIIAKVELTPEALKWKVDSMPQPKEDIDEDMKQPEFDLANYPEFSISCLESWPEIENPFIKKQESSTPKQNTTDNDTYTKKENQSNTDTETREPEGEDIERIEKSQYKAYIKAQDKFSSEYAILKAYSRSAVKARNIQIKNVDGIATAVAEVIIETDDVTNAGRVYYGIINGVRSKENVSLTYFIDKGWVIKNEMPSSEFPEYSDEIDV